MTRDEASLGARVAAGAVAGVVAGLAASWVMDRFQALTAPSSDSDAEPATEQAADRIARATTDAPVPDDAKPAAGQAVHYALGAALGAGYGIAAELAPVVTLGSGAAFGTAAWAVLDEAAVPAVGLGDAPWRSPAGTQAYGLASHLVFGVTAEIARRLALGLIARGRRLVG